MTLKSLFINDAETEIIGQCIFCGSEGLIVDEFPRRRYEKKK